MPASCHTTDVVSILDREVYSEAEAARLLRIPPSTLHYWLEGGQRQGKQYKPIIRVQPRGTRTVAWAEFIEAGLLRQYRNLAIPMAELRAFIQILRAELGVPYPLAHERPFASGKKLVQEAQVAANLRPEYHLVYATVGGQLMLTPTSAEFLHRVTWEGGVAAGWRPDANPQSPVRILPDVRFGRPSIKGISTETIWEQDESGVEAEELAKVYQLGLGDVRWALAYENAQRAA